MVTKVYTVEDVDGILEGISNAMKHGKHVNKDKAFKKADAYLDLRIELTSNSTKVVNSGRA